MRYLGSKTSLLEDIAHLLDDFGTDAVFCDPFGGIGTVGSYMKKKGFVVNTGDILYFAHCFQVAMIENNGEIDFRRLKEEIGVDEVAQVEDYLNQLAPKDGWLVEEYADKRKYFTEDNAKYIQACMDCIWNWKKENILCQKEYEILIASLIQSFDKVANTAGTYYAYLKEYYRKAKRPFSFQLIPPINSEKKCISYQMDAGELVKMCRYNILYLDPPYNERNYGRYYHLPENIARGVVPQPNGKSGVYAANPISSQYNKKSEATDAFRNLIKNADAECIIFHYTDLGMIGMDDAREILEEKGRLDEFYFDSKGYNTVSNAQKCRHHIIRVRKC